MTERDGLVPDGPNEAYLPTEDLLLWIARQFQCFGNIFQASIFGLPAYVTRDPQHAQHVLVTNWRNYRKGQLIRRVGLLLGNGLMTSEGESWQRQRRMIQPAFHRAVIDALCDMMTSTHLTLCERWTHAAREGQPVNVTRDIGRTVLVVTLAAIFGDDADRMARHFMVLADNPTRDMAFAEEFRALWQIVEQLIMRRYAAAEPRPDILGLMMRARDRKTGRGMSTHQLINETMTLIVAGHETTASTLTWLWYELSNAPAVERKLADELAARSPQRTISIDELAGLSYTRQIIEETLRLYPAGWLLTRRALRDDRLGDYRVRAGTEIYISPYFIQRNPDLWHDPDRFDPERFAPQRVKDLPPLAMLPFSAGPRNCIGEVFARVQMLVHLVTLARRLHLRPLKTGPAKLAAGVNLRSKSDLLMMPELN